MQRWVINPFSLVAVPPCPFERDKPRDRNTPPKHAAPRMKHIHQCVDDRFLRGTADDIHPVQEDQQQDAEDQVPRLTTLLAQLGLTTVIFIVESKQEIILLVQREVSQLEGHHASAWPFPVWLIPEYSGQLPWNRANDCNNNASRDFGQHRNADRSDQAKGCDGETEKPGAFLKCLAPDRPVQQAMTPANQQRQVRKQEQVRQTQCPLPFPCFLQISQPPAAPIRVPFPLPLEPP